MHYHLCISLVEYLWDIILIMCSNCLIICIISQCTVFLGSRAYQYYTCLTLCEHYIKKITMCSILKKIAVRKHYIYGIGSRSPNRSHGSRACLPLGYYQFRMFNAFAFRLHSAVYLHSVALIG